MKKLISVILVTTISCMFSLSAFAGNWEQSGDTWKYRNDDGTYVVNSWHQDPDHTWYYFGEDGYMWHDRWVDEKYYLGSTGGMLVDTITPDGFWVDKDGIRKSDEIISTSNGYTTVYKKTIPVLDNYYRGGGDLYCDYEFYYNEQVSTKNGTVYHIDGISWDKDKNPYIMYHLVSGYETLILKINDPENAIHLKSVKLKPNETSSKLYLSGYPKKCVLYIGNPYGRSSEDVNASNNGSTVLDETKYNKTFSQSINGSDVTVLCKNVYEGSTKHGKAEISQMFIDEENRAWINYNTITAGTMSGDDKLKIRIRGERVGVNGTEAIDGLIELNLFVASGTVMLYKIPDNTISVKIGIGGM